MTHEWMSGPLKFLLSAPVQLVFFSIYSKSLYSLAFSYCTVLYLYQSLNNNDKNDDDDDVKNL